MSATVSDKEQTTVDSSFMVNKNKYSKASRDTINVSQKKSCPAKSLILRSITIY